MYFFIILAAAVVFIAIVGWLANLEKPRTFERTIQELDLEPNDVFRLTSEISAITEIGDITYLTMDDKFKVNSISDDGHSIIIEESQFNNIYVVTTDDFIDNSINISHQKRNVTSKISGIQNSFNWQVFNEVHSELKKLELEDSQPSVELGRSIFERLRY